MRDESLGGDEEGAYQDPIDQDEYGEVRLCCLVDPDSHAQGQDSGPQCPCGRLCPDPSAPMEEGDSNVDEGNGGDVCG